MKLTLIEVRDRLLSKTKYVHLPETNQSLGQYRTYLIHKLDGFIQQCTDASSATPEGEEVGRD